MDWRIIYLAASASLLTISSALPQGCGCGRPEVTLDAPSAFVPPITNATLIVERKPSSPSFLNSVGRGRAKVTLHVRINNADMGTVDNGMQERFQYLTKPDGNTLQLTGDDGSVSQIIRFKAADNSSTEFVCRYMDGPDPDGYPIALRTQDDVTPTEKIKVNSIAFDREPEDDVLETLKERCRPGGHLVLEARDASSDQLQVIDTSSSTYQIGIAGHLEMFAGPILAGIKNLGAGATWNSSRETIASKLHSKEFRQSLVIPADGALHPVQKRRLYQTGMAEVVIEGKTAKVRFKRPIEDYYTFE